jgi:hypothetical protein
MAVFSIKLPLLWIYFINNRIRALIFIFIQPKP